MTTLPADDPWYELVDGPELQQGDLLTDFSWYSPEAPHLASGEDTELVERFDRVIILSQSCDLVEGDDFGIVCPVFSISTLQSRGESNNRLSEVWTKSRRGEIPHHHPLRKCDIEGHEFDYSLVVFARVLESRLVRLRQLAVEQSPRVRLRSPYREQLAQQFARKFMRVGLPLDLPDWSEVRDSLNA